MARQLQKNRVLLYPISALVLGTCLALPMGVPAAQAAQVAQTTLAAQPAHSLQLAQGQTPSAATVSALRPAFNPASDIEAYRAAHDWIGQAVSGIFSGLNEGASVQLFRNGQYEYLIYSHPKLGTFSVHGGMLSFYKADNYYLGQAGYPAGDEEYMGASTWRQKFQNGTLWVTPQGTYFKSNTASPIDKYASEHTAIGRPASKVFGGLTGGASVQLFRNARGYEYYVYSHPKLGTHAVTGGMRSYYEATGWYTGPLGYPLADEVALGSSTWMQQFEGGTLWVTPQGTFALLKSQPMGKYYHKNQKRLGIPALVEYDGLPGGATVQLFKLNGEENYVYSHPKLGTFTINGAIKDKYKARGWYTGPLGYPISEAADGKQTFEHGTLSASSIADDTASTSSAGGNTSSASGNTSSASGNTSSASDKPAPAPESGNEKEQAKPQPLSTDPQIEAYRKAHSWIGTPQSKVFAPLAQGASVQLFRNDQGIEYYVYAHPQVGTHAVTGGMRAYYEATGWYTGPLGYPVGDEETIGTNLWRQKFQNGVLWVSSTGTSAVLNNQPIGNYANKHPELGYPTSGIDCTLPLGGCAQIFSNSVTNYAVYQTPNGQVLSVDISSPLGKHYIDNDGPWGKFGYPTTPLTGQGASVSQTFEYGTISAYGASVQENMRGFSEAISSYGATSLMGFDISGHQKKLNVASLPTTTDFVIVKATGGNSFVNPYAVSQANAVLANNRRLGFYHFAHEATNQGYVDAVSEARHFVNQVRPYLKYRPMLVLDNESDNKFDVAWNKAWLDEVYRLTGVKAVIYMSQSVVNRVNWSSVAQSGYPLWVAYYPANASQQFVRMPYPSFYIKWWNKALMWQYSSRVKVPGYGGNLDSNVFYGSDKDWKYYTGPR